MRTDRERAMKMRLMGLSYGQIQKALGVPKSTLSSWLANIVLSEDARRRIKERSRKNSIAGLIKRNKQQTRNARKRCKVIRRNASSEIFDPDQQNILFIGIALYWAEGYKRAIQRGGREVTYHPVSLTNSDPYLVRLFILFLRKACSVPLKKIKANLRIFEHMNSDVAIRYWVKKTGIPRKNFTSTYVGTSRSSMNKRPFNRLPYGVIQIRISDTNLFHRIMGWIEGLKKYAAVAQW